VSDPEDAFRLDGRLALVTGAYGEFGEHICALMLDAGARVVVTGRDPRKREAAIGRLAARGEVFGAPLDVTDEGSVVRCFEAAIERAGQTPDIVVNNAGTAVTKPLLEQSEDDWQRVVDTNLGGCWRVAREGARRLVEAGRGGTIVNIASILGQRVAGGVAPYAIAKAGVVQMTCAMALELARYAIRVNALLPGYVVTDLNREFLESEAGEKLRRRIPTRRFGRLEDLDGPLLLLASSAGGHMTGSTVTVDGGHLVGSL